MKIVFMGTPEFSVPILEALNEKYEIKLVVSQPNQMGKKNKIIYTPVAQKAMELNLNIIQPQKIKDEEETLLNVDADVLVTAAYGQFIPTKILNKFKKCINVHGSILPKRRGGAPIQRSIIEGDAETGVTIMEMVKKMDAGRIYSVSKTPILDSDTNSTMFEKLSLMGKDLLMSSIEDIYNGINEGIPQDEDEVTISPNILVSEEKIDFNKDALDVFNQIRGLADNPGAHCEINGSRIKVYKSKIVEDNSLSAPGQIILMKKRLVIKCLKDAIEFLEVKPEGKNKMDSSSFLNGQHLFTIDDHFE